VVSIDPEKLTSESIAVLCIGVKARQVLTSVGAIGGTITLLGCGLHPIDRDGASFLIEN
jgi:hypothetical protein